MRKRTYTPLQAVACEGAAGAAAGQRDEGDCGFPVPVCHNIVSTSQIHTPSQSIDLQRVSLLLPNSRYDRRRFAAITIRIKNPNCTGLLFSSGKLVITGSVSMHACILAAHTISQLLRECDPSDDFRITSCVVQNIVAHAEIPPNCTFDVDSFYKAYCEYATYQKNVFPGLVFRPPDSPIVLLIFASGKIVCTGGKSCNDIYSGFRRLYPLLQPYIVHALAAPPDEAVDGAPPKPAVSTDVLLASISGARCQTNCAAPDETAAALAHIAAGDGA